MPKTLHLAHPPLLIPVLTFPFYAELSWNRDRAVFMYMVSILMSDKQILAYRVHPIHRSSTLSYDSLLDALHDVADIIIRHYAV